jgi:hypothetical protein
MGDRFYQAQIKELGTCPGYTGKGKKKKMAWDDTKKQKAISMYTDAGPTPETSMEIVKDIAEDLDESPNGVRMILTKAGVYVTKGPAKAGSAAPKGDGAPRVSKEAAHAKLTAAINDIGADVDSEIISKLTGKAALYIADVLAQASK